MVLQACLWQWSDLGFGAFFVPDRLRLLSSVLARGHCCGSTTGQPGPRSCLMAELKVAPMLPGQDTGLLLHPSQEISLVPSCGTPSSSLLTQGREEGLCLQGGQQGAGHSHLRDSQTPTAFLRPHTQGRNPRQAQPSTGEQQGRTEHQQHSPALLR